MKQSLKLAIENKFANKRLSEEQLQALQDMQSGHYPARPDNVWGKVVSFAGVAAVALLLGVLLAQWIGNKNLPMTQRIANEVVKNHLRLKPLEVKTNTIAGVRGYFTQLSFKPISSRLLPRLPKTLIGGRYCSLQGITAAQLRLKQTSGTVDTLYQTEYRADVFGNLPDIGKDESPLIAYAKGIKVRIWTEKGVLFALTEVDS